MGRRRRMPFAAGETSSGRRQPCRTRVGGMPWACAAAVFVILLRGSSAWWETPHELTAAVAWQWMDTATRDDAATMINMLAAYWPESPSFVEAGAY